MKLYLKLIVVLLIFIYCLEAKKTYASTSTNLAVILFTFQDSGDPPFSQTDVNQKMFTDTESVKNYYKEVSYNNLEINGQVFDWITIPFDKPTQNKPVECSIINDYIASADNNLTASGTNLNNFQYKFYISSSFIYGCSVGGMGIYKSGFSAGENNLLIFLHELGHMFGLAHANFLNCGSKSIDSYQNCQTFEYDDPYDVMGMNISHLNAPHKMNLLWLPYSQVQNITTDGEYQIDAIELNSNNTQALKIPKPDTREYYFLEYRQPIGLDQKLDARLFGGVSIRIWNNSPGSPTRLIDPILTSGVSSNYRPLLYDNEEFYDQINNIRIKQISHDQNNVRLSIEVSKLPMLGYKIEGQHINQYGEPISTSEQSIVINRLDGSQFTDTTHLSPDWGFTDLEIGFYSVTASPIVGYRIASSMCSNCNFHNSYSGKNMRQITFSPTDNFVNISFKYLSNKGDINNDRNINYDDIALLKSAYDTNNIEANLNDDQTVNIYDYSQLIKNYGGKIQ